MKTFNLIAPASVSTLLKETAKLIPVDASWYMPNVPISAYHEYMKKRLTNAVFVDIDTIKDPKSPYPHMLPTKEDFERHISYLGINSDSNLLFYDQQGIFSACRALWMFDLFGHKGDLNLLNTYPAYAQSNSDPNLVLKVHGASKFIDDKLVTAPTSLSPSKYEAVFDKSQVVSYEELLELVKSKKIDSEITLIDARSEGRFTGAEPEPRPNLPSGHVPGAINIPFNALLTPQKAFLSIMSLKNIFANKKIDPAKPIVVMCGTGVTACVVRAGLILAGYKNISVYDGSWTEWVQRSPQELIQRDL